MNSQHQETLTTVFSEIIESLAFMFVEDPEDDTVFTTGTEFVQVQMGFSGPFKGDLTIAVPVDMCPELASNVLGLDPDDELVTHNPYDALKELLNIICGNLLTALAGEEPVFDLTIPEVTLLDKAGWTAFMEKEGTVRFVADDNPVLLRLVA